jgi:transcriptional regulator with XRE-family HTH domain
VVEIVIAASQIRAARALLDLNQAELSELASVSATTIKRLEAVNQVRGAAETLWKIESTLTKLGIEFISAEGGKGPGVRLRSAPRESRKPKAKRRGVQRRL